MNMVGLFIGCISGLLGYLCASMFGFSMYEFKGIIAALPWWLLGGMISACISMLK